MYFHPSNLFTNGIKIGFFCPLGHNEFSGKRLCNKRTIFVRVNVVACVCKQKYTIYDMLVLYIDALLYVLQNIRDMYHQENLQSVTFIQ